MEGVASDTFNMGGRYQFHVSEMEKMLSEENPDPLQALIYLEFAINMGRLCRYTKIGIAISMAEGYVKGEGQSNYDAKRILSCAKNLLSDG